MSLHVLANHMATKGRGPDSMLVHMSPQEVASLQALAMKNGGSLTINPDTGLPEAGWLSKLLPAIAGFALNAFAPGIGTAIGGALGLGGAAGTAIGIGGITGLATGSLSKGLMAGLGAYGGAGLAEGLATSGAGAIGRAAEGIQGPIGSPESGFGATQAIDAVDKGSQIGTGFKAVTDNSAALGQFAKDNWKMGLAAASPVIADAMVPTTVKAPEMATGYIRPYQYDANTRTVKAMSPVLASEWGTRQFPDFIRKTQATPTTQGAALSPMQPPGGMARGGIVALADGGATDPYARYNQLSGQSKAAYDYLMGNASSMAPSGVVIPTRPVVSNTNAPVTAPTDETPVETLPTDKPVNPAGDPYITTVPGIGGPTTGITPDVDPYVPSVEPVVEPLPEPAPYDDTPVDYPEPVVEPMPEPEPYDDTPVDYPEPEPVAVDDGTTEGIQEVVREMPAPAEEPGFQDDPYFYQPYTEPVPVEEPGFQDDPYFYNDAYTPELLPTEGPVYTEETPYEVQPWENVADSGYGTYTGNSYPSSEGLPDAFGSYPGEATYIEPSRDSEEVFEPGTAGYGYNISDPAGGIVGGDSSIFGGLGGAEAVGAGGIDLGGLRTYTGNFRKEQEEYACGGMIPGYALGGLGSLGGYSDGGRLLKGPGDGVSDSIPATIGRGKQPARLADGEFVVPARIVSELGNGSTEAGARKLYAMMARIQKARGKTVGKGKVAANSRADKHLPA